MRSMLSSMSLALVLLAACRNDDVAQSQISQPKVAPIRDESSDVNVGPANIGRSICDDCAAEAQRWLDGLAPSRTTFVDAICPETEGISGDKWCQCVHSDGSALTIAPDYSDGCAVHGRGGFCLMLANEITTCNAELPEVCSALCANVERRLADDASKALDAEMRLAQCGSSGCQYIASINGQCYAGSEGLKLFPTPYDCGRADDDILSAAKDDAAAAESQCWAEEQDRFPDQAGPSAEPPAPEACLGGATPSVFVSDPAQDIGEIALSATHVYWYSSKAAAIFRQSKAGGSPEKVTDVEPGGGGLRIDASRLYWWRFPTIYGMPLDGQSAPVALVSDATDNTAWTPVGSRVYYTSDPGAASGALSGLSYDLRAAPNTGGASELLLNSDANPGNLFPPYLTADATGIYWTRGWAVHRPSVRCQPPGAPLPQPGEIEKYTFATQAVTSFTPTEGFVQSIYSTGDHVIWSGSDGVWASKGDGQGAVRLSAAGRLIRAITSDGSFAYWAASAPQNGYSDIFAAPLDGGEARKVACQVYAIDQMQADASALYYRSWVGDVIGRIPTAAR